MATLLLAPLNSLPPTLQLRNPNPKINTHHTSTFPTPFKPRRHRTQIIRASEKKQQQDSNPKTLQDDEVNDVGVKVALSMLRFYKREISPVLPTSRRYVPTCSEYSMEAYKRYGVVKGTVLTAWRLCRCNPLGGYGYDPPRWFGEASPREEELDD
uniref:Uncharacterized protein n=1 Tax=Lotus japonicus TaxID=34305 RepID=I3SWA5_LOTJA|nr:unknown [Lotus japonicus]